MSEDEMIEEFEARIAAILRRSDAVTRPNGLITYNADYWSVAGTLNDYVEIEVSNATGHCIAYQRGKGMKGRIVIEDYEAEELLKDMRTHMILDDLADA